MESALSLPNEMQYTIRELYSTECKGTLRSVRIKRVVKPSDPLTIINDISFCKSPKWDAIYDPLCVLYGAQGHLTIRTDRSLPNEMQDMIRELYTLRSGRALNDPCKWSELNMLLTKKRYNAGVLDNPSQRTSPFSSTDYVCTHF